MTAYRGRFAPSPTGMLHFGSLISALASYVQARSQDGTWLIRMEDLDGPREVPGAARQIIEDLAAFGMQSDEPVLYQSSRTDAYEHAIDRLRDAGLAFDCGCSRSDLPRDGVYPGTCRDGIPGEKSARSVRLRVPDRVVGFVDGLQGPFEQNLGQDVGDFVIRRADGLTAYQLAVVVDDAEQGITEVFRGSDLLDSTPRQLYLMEQLGLSPPAHAHHPIVLDEEGRKMSKQSRSQPVDAADPMPALLAAWAFLGQSAPPNAARLRPGPFLRWSADQWRLASIPQRQSIAS